MTTRSRGLPPPGGLALSPVLGAVAVLLVAGAVVARAQPWLLSLLWQCTFKELTGIPCLTCGLTRVLVHLAGGEVLAAFALAPLPASAVVLALVAGGWYVGARLTGRALPDEVIGRWLRVSAVRWGVVASGLALWGYAIARSLSTGAP